MKSAFWPDLPPVQHVNADLVHFLDRIECIMSTRPSAKDASITFDDAQIRSDTDFITSFDGDLTSALQFLIQDRQAQSAHRHLNPASVNYFKKYPRFQ